MRPLFHPSAMTKRVDQNFKVFFYSVKTHFFLFQTEKSNKKISYFFFVFLISLPILTFAFYFQFFAFLSSITRLLLYDSFIDFFFYDSGAHGVESRSRRINTAAGTVRRRFLRPRRESKKSELISFSHSYSDRSLFYCDYRDDRMSSGHCLAPTLMTRRRAEENKSPN